MPNDEFFEAKKINKRVVRKFYRLNIQKFEIRKTAQISQIHFDIILFRIAV